MARATLRKELHFEAGDETGLLGRVVIAMAIEGVSIIHLSAYTANRRGYLQMVTENNAKAKKALEPFIKGIEERDVLVVEFENKTGTLAPVAKLLGNHGIHIDYVYGTSGDGFKIVGIFSTADNVKAAELINQDSGSLNLPQPS